MRILGISAHYHDSAAALRGRRRAGRARCRRSGSRGARTTPRFPLAAIEWCLERGGLEPEELDAVVFYEKPMLKFERILTMALRGVPALVAQLPAGDEEHARREGVGARASSPRSSACRREKILFTEHHQAHAAAAFLTAPTRARRRSSPPTASASGRR